MDGILNINKAAGMTSHDVVASIRRLLKEKRAGHAGTLDPLASGVLPICVGQATRVAEYVSESGKEYLATIIFGSVTDTYDAEGTILRTASTADLSQARVEEALEHFVGPQLQIPPRYSAIKLQGQPAYKRVRAGEEVELAPRPIVIHKLEVVEWNLPSRLICYGETSRVEERYGPTPGRDQSGPYPPFQSDPPAVTLTVECSKGTYIRSLAYDLGEYLGCGAYLAALKRTRSGPFLLSESVTLEQLRTVMEAVAGDRRGEIDPGRGIQGGRPPGSPLHYLYPIDKALEGHPALVLDTAMVERVLHGNAFRYFREENISPTTGIARVYSEDGRFVAIAEWDAAQAIWKPRKVFTGS